LLIVKAAIAASNKRVTEIRNGRPKTKPVPDPAGFLQNVVQPDGHVTVDDIRPM
jgi:hypothetical protein